MPEGEKKPKRDPIDTLKLMLTVIPSHLKDVKAFIRQYGNEKHKMLFQVRRTAIQSTISAWDLAFNEEEISKPEYEYTNAVGTIGIYKEDYPDLPSLFSDDENKFMEKTLDLIDKKIFPPKQRV